MPYDTGSITNARTIGIGLELTPDQQRQQERLAQLESLRFEYQQAYHEFMRHDPTIEPAEVDRMVRGHMAMMRAYDPEQDL